MLRQDFPDKAFEGVLVTKKRGRPSVQKTPSSPAEKSPPKKKATSDPVVGEILHKEIEVAITGTDKVE